MKKMKLPTGALIVLRTIRRSAYLCAVIILLALIVWLLHERAGTSISNAYEDISYALAPSAQKAMYYGDLHFSATDWAHYDIARAKYFFYLAAQSDPTLPYVWHQLARVSFIQDDLVKAKVQIDYQIAQHGDATPESFYMRGLIEAFMTDYAAAEVDYAHYMTLNPISWAGANDYAWVLLKDGKPMRADHVVSLLLPYYPKNVWLLNTDAIALSEMGSSTAARQRIEQASTVLPSLTAMDWSRAYPGNDPLTAADGIAQFKSAVTSNIHSIMSGVPIKVLQ